MSPKTYLDQKIGSVIGFTGDWWQDTQGNILTYCCLDSTPREFGRFGLLFAREGDWDGQAVLSETWVTESNRACDFRSIRFLLVASTKFRVLQL